MIQEILTAAGVLHRQGRFPKPPPSTYAVYFDDVEVNAADRVGSVHSAGQPKIYTHNVMVELYEPAPDDATEAALEAELDAWGLSWAKQDRYWLQESQRYVVTYDFIYHTKRRK